MKISENIVRTENSDVNLLAEVDKDGSIRFKGKFPKAFSKNKGFDLVVNEEQLSSLIFALMELHDGLYEINKKNNK